MSKILVFLRGNPDVKLIKNDMDTFNRICSILEFKRFPTPTDDFWSQIEMLNLINSGQKVISSSEYELSEVMVNSFLTHPYTEKIFNPEIGIEVLNQVVFIVKIKGVDVKILVDKILVNHDKKEISVYDIKTGSFHFLKNFHNYKYYYQGALYYTAIVEFLKSIPEFFDYKIVDGFNFIYVGRDNPSVPYIYNMDVEYIDIILHGYEGYSGFEVKGIYELIDDYLWYKENKIYDTTKEIYEKSGVINIKTPKTWKIKE